MDTSSEILGNQLLCVQWTFSLHVCDIKNFKDWTALIWNWIKNNNRCANGWPLGALPTLPSPLSSLQRVRTDRVVRRCQSNRTKKWEENPPKSFGRKMRQDKVLAGNLTILPAQQTHTHSFSLILWWTDVEVNECSPYELRWMLMVYKEQKIRCVKILGPRIKIVPWLNEQVLKRTKLILDVNKKKWNKNFRIKYLKRTIFENPS